VGERGGVVYSLRRSCKIGCLNFSGFKPHLMVQNGGKCKGCVVQEIEFSKVRGA